MARLWISLVVDTTDGSIVEDEATGLVDYPEDVVVAVELVARGAERHGPDPADAQIALDELHDRDGQTLFELCTRLTMKHELGLSRQAISQHLEVLEAAGLVSSRREGRYKFHYLDTTPLKGIVQRWSLED